MNKIDIIRLVRKTIKYGDFTLHSGQKSSWISDMSVIQDDFKNIIDNMSSYGIVVGIEFNGAILAKLFNNVKSGIIRKNGIVYIDRSEMGHSDYITLIDDVVTTESSFKWAATICKEESFLISGYSVILDRRKKEDISLTINSLVTCYDLGLEP